MSQGQVNMTVADGSRMSATSLMTYFGWRIVGMSQRIEITKNLYDSDDVNNWLTLEAFISAMFMSIKASNVLRITP